MAELPKDMIFHYHSDNGITIKVDAIPLVRCKDCKHTKNDGCGAIYCKVWDRWEMPKDYFCADGERR